MTALPPQRSAMEVAPSGPTPPTSAHHIQAPPPGASNPPIDCYEDMFKEITRKLYGEEGLPDYQGAERALTSLVSADRTLTTIDYDAEGNAFKPEDHITAFGLAALMQNGFPPPGILNANFAPKLATNASTATGAAAANAEDKWTASEELLPWTTSRIASYNPAQKLFRCAECECVGFLGRVAEHWLGAHGALRPFQCPQCPYASAWSRCAKIHLTREHNVPDASADAVFKENPVLDEVTRYLQRLKGKVDTPGTVNRSLSVTNAPATTATSANAAAVPTENAEGEGSANASAAVTKRYNCGFCPYATDRRDLYTRHENIHREEKPFQCYVCQKQFNRADHVKKHFLRMHREHPYDINRIRKQPSPAKSPVYSYPKFGEATGQMSAFQQQPGTAAGTNQQPQRIQKVDNNKAEAKTSPDKPGSKKKGEKRYACCYCSWAGVDNWCLKRHLNTHLKPFVCALCDYKAARSERLATHVLKVHNKKACGKCNFLAEDQAQLVIHQQEQHALDSRQPRSTNAAANNSPGHSGMLRSLGPLTPFQGGGGAGPNVGPLHNAPTTVTPFGSIVANVRPNLNESQQQHHQQQQQQQQAQQQQQQQWRPQKQGAERLFHYMEVSDSSDLDDQQYNTSRLQPVMQTISQDFHKAGGMQWTKNNNAYGISPGKRMRLDGNKENIVKTHRPYYEPLEKSSKPSARKSSSSSAPARAQGPEVTMMSPEVLNLKMKRELDSEDAIVDSDNKTNLNAFAHLHKAQSDCLGMSTASSLDSGDDRMDYENGTNQESERIDGKRSRKQTQPRKVAHKTNTKVTLASIRDEYLTKHITRKSINCSLCPETDYSYHTKLSLAIHMSLRHKNDILACIYCGVDFEYDFLVKSHNKDCIRLHSAITNNNSASVSRPKNITDQRVPDF